MWGQDSHLCGQLPSAEPCCGPSGSGTVGQCIPSARASVFSSAQWGHSRPSMQDGWEGSGGQQEFRVPAPCPAHCRGPGKCAGWASGLRSRGSLQKVWKELVLVSAALLLPGAQGSPWNRPEGGAGRRQALGGRSGNLWGSFGTPAHLEGRPPTLSQGATLCLSVVTAGSRYAVLGGGKGHSASGLPALGAPHHLWSVRGLSSGPGFSWISITQAPSDKLHLPPGLPLAFSLSSR